VNSSSSIVITGAAGMLGRTLVRRLAHRPLQAFNRSQLDLVDLDATDAVIAAIKPKTVLNCAAMTAVDRCESERDAAYAGNAVSAANLARSCEKHGARLIHFSTDYVFAGDLDRPYHEADQPAPRTVYGASKLAGEDAIRELCGRHLIVRTAWLYGPGGPSFVHTMLRLGALAGPPLTVVDDQIGNPTSTDAVATVVDRLIDTPREGTMHLTCSGSATWCDFAREIMALWRLPRQVTACTTAQFPRPAPRPANSRLDSSALSRHGLPAPPHWRDALQHFHKDFVDG